MELTPQQVASFEKFIDSRFQLLWQQHHSSIKTNEKYHTKDEIRNIIDANINDIASFLGPDSFSVAVLHHYLGKFVKYREGDHSLHPGGGTRWKSQVTGVVSTHPRFEQTGTVGTYKLAELPSFSSNNLFSQQQ